MNSFILFYFITVIVALEFLETHRMELQQFHCATIVNREADPDP